MFDGIGFMELLLIGIIGLVVLGPERLPVAVRTVAGWIKAIKRMVNSVKDELEQELNIEQLHKDLKEAESKGLANLSPELQESIDKLKQAAESVNRPYKVDSETSSSSEQADKPSVVDEDSQKSPAPKADMTSKPADHNG
ncbi:Sec-independent protein translocase subunit TatB [Parashewanella curva]|uniref:Sec-independent protein translocase protein TatB n=1 Tax=Parashewanella curva TaxID=2338552 RepID=A0A3L8Q146_9GAMM|nr:Sec-independent protein translocase protein TatB [Parashewanella curva]RLV61361.1 Sec-independent protein translocase subunit TatB [Parashewanella curva]